MDLEALCRASSVERPAVLLLLVTEDVVIPMDTLYGVLPSMRPTELTDCGSNPLSLKFSPRSQGTDFVGVAKRVGDVFESYVTALKTAGWITNGC